MKSNLHDTLLRQQMAAVLVLLNAIALREVYLQEGSDDYAGWAFFLLAMVAIYRWYKARFPANL